MPTPTSDFPCAVPAVMVSSTFTDLTEHRAALITAINQHRLHPHVMENDSARLVDVIESSLAMVRDSAAYIGVISLKYGQTPEDEKRNPDRLSITELEFNEAQALGRPILLFIMDEDHLVKASDIETDPAKLEKLNAFRNRAKRIGPESNVHRVYAAFVSVEDFKAKIGTSLSELSQFLSERYGKTPLSLNTSAHPQATAPAPREAAPVDTLSVLQRELDEALVNYSSKRVMWVERDIADAPETRAGAVTSIFFTPAELAQRLCDCIIRAPAEFGLTSVGRKIALEHFMRSKDGRVCIYIDGGEDEVHRRAVESALYERLTALGKRDKADIAAIIVDRWERDSRGKKLLQSIRQFDDKCPIVLLEQIDLGRDIERVFDTASFDHGKVYYLWALTQNRVRELVESYVEDLPALDPSLVTTRILKDIENLNIFRTPQNCLMFLRLAEQAFDESPVNRTELIHRVLFLLFYQFDQIPRYATRPDLKDCEYVLGYLCEWLMKEGKTTFSKSEFVLKGTQYCGEQFISVDIEILFSFLFASRIIVFNGVSFQFRFTYWTQYFAAHRMHHNADFADFVLSDRRYAAFPTIIEFYTGIDRRRVEAVRIITRDLNELSSVVSGKTQIPVAFDPFAIAKWKPTSDNIASLRSEIESSIASSSLPTAVKDAIADRRYDRTRPYAQEIAKFVDQASLLQMFRAASGAARALRNSDHVPPAEKLALLSAVCDCMTRVSQVVAVIAPILSEHNQAECEGMNFVLSGFDTIAERTERFSKIIESIPGNVVNWFEDDLYSAKLALLLAKHIESSHGTIAEILLLMISIRQRPHGWAKGVDRFINSASTDSFGLLTIFLELREQLKIGFVSDADREHIYRLSQKSLAKHSLRSEDPNRDQLRAAAKALRDPLPPTSSELRHAKSPRGSRERRE